MGDRDEERDVDAVTSRLENSRRPRFEPRRLEHHQEFVRRDHRPNRRILRRDS
jgi:hypothetical protein